MEILRWLLGLSVLLVLVGLVWFFYNPFTYPYFDWEFTDKWSDHNVMWHIDKFLLDDANFKRIMDHEKQVQAWKRTCESRMPCGWLYKHRILQYSACLDEGHTYRFLVKRHKNERIRHKQEACTCLSLEWLMWRYQMLCENKEKC